MTWPHSLVTFPSFNPHFIGTNSFNWLLQNRRTYSLIPFFRLIFIRGRTHTLLLMGFSLFLLIIVWVLYFLFLLPRWGKLWTAILSCCSFIAFFALHLLNLLIGLLFLFKFVLFFVGRRLTSGFRDYFS